MRFQPFVFDGQGEQIPVTIVPMTPHDAESTNTEPVWQTSWTSEFLTDEKFQRYAAKIGDEVIALAAYEILEDALVVHIVYMEAHPESNPTASNVPIVRPQISDRRRSCEADLFHIFDLRRGGGLYG